MGKLPRCCWVVVPFALVTACGGDATTDFGGGGAGGSTSTSTSTSTTSSGNSCSDFLPPDDLGGPVTIRIENNTTADLYIGDPNQSCGSVPIYALHGPADEVLNGGLDGCEYSCEQLQSGSCGCTGDCMAPHVIRVTAGGALVTEWGGYHYVATEMPAECFFDAMCAPSCLLETVAPDEVEVHATVYPEVSCGGGSGGCTCEPDADGSCTIWDGAPTPTGTPTETQATWTTGETSVTLTIGP